ncbi:hypothetical protein BH23PLA1_BH23PLA1_32130 [soil metagenome]
MTDAKYLIIAAVFVVPIVAYIAWWVRRKRRWQSGEGD